MYRNSSSGFLQVLGHAQSITTGIWFPVLSTASRTPWMRSTHSFGMPTKSPNLTKCGSHCECRKRSSVRCEVDDLMLPVRCPRLTTVGISYGAELPESNSNVCLIRLVYTLLWLIVALGFPIQRPPRFHSQRKTRVL